MERMGSTPNLSVKWSISIDTMLNYDGDQHGHGDGDGTCKQAFSFLTKPSKSLRKIGCNPHLTRHDANVDAEAATKSLTLGVN